MKKLKNLLLPPHWANLGMYEDFQVSRILLIKIAKSFLAILGDLEGKKNIIFWRKNFNWKKWKVQAYFLPVCTHWSRRKKKPLMMKLLFYYIKKPTHSKLWKPSFLDAPSCLFTLISAAQSKMTRHKTRYNDKVNKTIASFHLDLKILGIEHSNYLGRCFSPKYYVFA